MPGCDNISIGFATSKRAPYPWLTGSQDKAFVDSRCGSETRYLAENSGHLESSTWQTENVIPRQGMSAAPGWGVLCCHPLPASRTHCPPDGAAYGSPAR